MGSLRVVVSAVNIAGVPSVSTHTIPFHCTSSLAALETLVHFIKVMKLEVVARAWFHIFTLRAFIKGHVGLLGLLPMGGLPKLNLRFGVGLYGDSGIPAYFPFKFKLVGFELRVTFEECIDPFACNGSRDTNQFAGDDLLFFEGEQTTG